MDDMRIVFLVVGTIAITALMIHGFYTVQKNKPKPQNRRTPTAKGKRPSQTQPEPEEPAPLAPMRAVEPEPQLESEPMPAQPSLLAEEDAPIPEPQAKVSRPRQPVRQEPSMQEEQIELGLPEPAPIKAAVSEPEIDIEAPSAPAFRAEPEPVEPEPEPEVDQLADSQEPTDVLVLYVVGENGGDIRGDELLPNLTTMGFKFGDMEIFHRHQHSGGNGPVLYSLANMHQPGTFDLDGMEQFSTEGVVLFLTLPSNNDARVVFSTMLGNAQGLADLHGGLVLDDQRQPWTDAAYESYLQRIKQSERVTA